MTKAQTTRHTKSSLSARNHSTPGRIKNKSVTSLPGPDHAAVRKPSNKKATVITVDVDEKGRRNSNKQEIFGGSLYSKALLRGKDETESAQNESLCFLEGTHHFFFRKCKTFPPELSSFNPKNKRGIWNSFGRVLYYTGENKNYVCRRCHYSGFTQEVVDYTGKSVLMAVGRQFIFGLNSSVEIFLENGRILGTMRQSCLSSTYEIKDSSGRLIYKIQAPCFAPFAPFVLWCCKENFEICMDDGVTEIGKITKFWGDGIDVREFQSCLGIEMDRVVDVRVKALLLGCFFLIEFQYYRGGGNGPIYFILLLLIFAGLVAVSECAGYCPFWLDRFVERVDVL